MKIVNGNFVEASGPSFECTSNIPLSNLPIYIYEYILTNMESTINWTVVAMKPSSFNTRVLELQARILVRTLRPQYVFTYQFSPNDQVYQVYKQEIVYATTPNGTFSIEGDSAVYNAADYWTYSRSHNEITLIFTPVSSMDLAYHYIYYDMVI